MASSIPDRLQRSRSTRAHSGSRSCSRWRRRIRTRRAFTESTRRCSLTASSSLDDIETMAEGRDKTTKERLDKHDRQIAAIRDLVQQGMRLVVLTRRELHALTIAQRKTDATLRAFIESMNPGGNGHDPPTLDLHKRLRSVRLLFALIIFFILYGTLYPFQFDFHRTDLSPLWILLHSWPLYFSRFLLRDAVTNVLLYMPLGFTGAVVFGRRWW